MSNIKKKPDNVIDISGNVELVMKLAADKLDAGDHIGALSLMRRAETIEPGYACNRGNIQRDEQVHRVACLFLMRPEFRS